MMYTNIEHLIKAGNVQLIIAINNKCMSMSTYTSICPHEHMYTGGWMDGGVYFWLLLELLFH